MMVMIVFNNLMVAGKMYISGIFLGLGSLYALLQNCIMLGTFQTFFENEGVLQQSAQGIWVHGAFEISAIIIVAMCGLILGTSVLFPKTYSRTQAFQKGVRDSFRIYLSTFPFIIVAGILEGFVTRYALTMSFGLNVSIILSCFFLIIFYYVIYPFIIHKKHNSYATLSEERLWSAH